MRILGIHDAIDSGSAIIEDGKIAAAMGEERVIRSKLAYGFPRRSIYAVMEVAGVGPKDIDLVAVATKNNYFVNDIVPFVGWYESRNHTFRSMFMKVAFQVSPIATKLGFLERSYYLLRYPIFIHRRRKIKQVLREEMGINCPVEFIDHHVAHAASAYYSSGYRDATVITLDGGGDGRSASVYAVREGEFEKLSENSSLNSIGNFYSYVTHICGFTTHKHEGKITGLAAYGVPRHIELFRSLITHKDGKFINTKKLFGSSAIKCIRDSLPENFSHADLAASIQQHLEEMVSEYVRYWTKETKLNRVAVAGGIFANVKVNQRLHELDTVTDIFVHPAMGDDGVAVGASWAAYGQRTEVDEEFPNTEPIKGVYLGHEFSEREIEAELKKAGLDYSLSGEIEREIASLLAEGHVVARFDGRMEYGPRALGNRSILYQPTDPSVNDWLNKNLVRTEFMPFAPSTLAEYANQCFVGVEGAFEPARFMTITFDCTDWMRENCPGVVHIDGTARPQLVRKQDNESYYKIIEEYHRLTGLPCIINTSFNMHEEPIVCSPYNAIRAFQLGHLDYLAIGNFLVRNEGSIGRTLVPSSNANIAVQS